ncbi:MAG: ABC transporter permease [Phycisphaerae bacterium]|nr:ABC transporter permease [Phycisphaerae bacterium]MDD5380777.1 ABC transporter permease [Phycisphaerae bacterium]
MSRGILKYVIGLLLAPIFFLRLLYQSSFLAIGQIWAKKGRSVLTTTGIVIAVASITAVIASLTGLKSKVLSDLETFGAKTIWVWFQRPDTGPKKDITWWELRFWPDEFDGLLEHCPSVAKYTRISSVYHRLIGHYEENSVEGVQLLGVDVGWEEIANRPVIMGRPFSEIDQSEGRFVCYIESKLRDALRMNRDCIGEMVTVRGRSYMVIGVIEPRPDFAVIDVGNRTEGYEMYIPYNAFLKLGDKRPHIYVMATSNSPEVSGEAVTEIKFFMRQARRPALSPGEPDTFGAESMQSAMQQFNQLSQVITLVAGGVVGISLIVGGVGIMNIMLVSVSERTREIGLRKAIGAKRSAILTQFLVESIVLCFIGGIIGLGLGKLLTMGICSINKMMNLSHIPLWAVVLSFGFCGIVGITFGMFPAIKAARLDPIEALRHE